MEPVAGRAVRCHLVHDGARPDVAFAAFADVGHADVARLLRLRDIVAGRAGLRGVLGVGESGLGHPVACGGHRRYLPAAAVAAHVVAGLADLARFEQVAQGALRTLIRDAQRLLAIARCQYGAWPPALHVLRRRDARRSVAQHEAGVELAQHSGDRFFGAVGYLALGQLGLEGERMAFLAVLFHRYRSHETPAVDRLVAARAFEDCALLRPRAAHSGAVHVEGVIELEVRVFDQGGRALSALAHPPHDTRRGGVQHGQAERRVIHAKICDVVRAGLGGERLDVAMAVRALLLRPRSHLDALVVAMTLRAARLGERQPLLARQLRARDVLLDLLMTGETGPVANLHERILMTGAAVRAEYLMAA